MYIIYLDQFILTNTSITNNTQLMSNINTRKKTCHFKLGHPSLLSPSCLPLEVDVYNAIVQSRLDLQATSSSNKPIQNKEIYLKVLEDLKHIWIDKGNLPVISDRTILEKIEKVHIKGKSLLKIPNERRLKMLESDPSKVNKNKSHEIDMLHKLFDICSCKCETRDSCSCPGTRKVSLREWEFLVDQKTDRKMQIGNIDKQVTDQWQKKEKRKETDLLKVQKEKKRVEELLVDNDDYESFEDEEDVTVSEEYSREDSEFIGTSSTPSVSEQMRNNLDNFIMECDRYTFYR